MHVKFVRAFKARLSAPTEDGCREWLGHRNRAGYGRVRRPGENQQQAHRIAWEIAFGPIPEGLNVCHRCDNPPCCEPSHLFLGTQADNIADRDAKGRRSPGQRRGRRKLTDDAIAEIRRRRDEPHVRLATEFGVNRSTVYRIATDRIHREG